MILQVDVADLDAAVALLEVDRVAELEAAAELALLADGRIRQQVEPDRAFDVGQPAGGEGADAEVVDVRSSSTRWPRGGVNAASLSRTAW